MMFLPREPFPARSQDNGFVSIVPSHIGEHGAPTLSPLTIAKLMRRWQAAKTLDDPAQPVLYHILAPLGLDILAPVFDGLFTAYLQVMKRQLQTGCGVEFSADETAMNALLMWRSTSETIPPLILSRAAMSAQLMLWLAFREGKPTKP